MLCINSYETQLRDYDEPTYSPNESLYTYKIIMYTTNAKKQKEKLFQI